MKFLLYTFVANKDFISDSILDSSLKPFKILELGFTQYPKHLSSVHELPIRAPCSVSIAREAIAIVDYLKCYSFLNYNSVCFVLS